MPDETDAGEAKSGGPEMKRVLWICNIMMPVIAKQLSLPYSNREGWLTGNFNRLLAEEEKQIELGICFPVSGGNPPIEQVNPLLVEGVPCYGFSEDLVHPENYDEALEKRFAEIFAHFQPDIIHIFGTEFPHALAAAKVFGRPERTLVGIQGLCHEIAKVYQAGVPDEVFKQVTFRDLVRRDSLKQQQEKFVIRGEREKEIISLAGHITGRTAFDREATARINPKAKYYPMNETLRSSFYEGKWREDTCEEHSIFLAQGDYPLKGFHVLLKALPILRKQYPDVKVYVAGNSVIHDANIKDKIKISAYGKYLLKLIRENHLEQQVVVLGKLKEEEMKETYLKSSAFVCPSTLDNSPNTVGEAMLLGMPVVASFVGGIPDMVTDGKDGLLVPKENPQALAEAIIKLWSEEKGADGLTPAERLGENAAKRARITHDNARNYQRLMEIYEDIGACQ